MSILAALDEFVCRLLRGGNKTGGVLRVDPKPEQTHHWVSVDGTLHLYVNTDTDLIVGRIHPIAGKAWRGNVIGSGRVLDYITLDAAKRSIEQHVVSL